MRHRLAVARDDDLLPLLHGVNQFGEPPLRFGHADIHVLNDDYIFVSQRPAGEESKDKRGLELTNKPASSCADRNGLLNGCPGFSRVSACKPTA